MTGRLCACGCGESLEGKHPAARYATDACRARAWKDRTGYTDPRAAKPYRNGRKTARRSPDLRISYRKALAAILPYVGSSERAEFILRPLLTDKQLAHLTGSGS